MLNMGSKIEYDFPNHQNQYISVFAANLIFMSHGCMIGWIAPASPQLMSNETPLKTGPLTFEQLSWIGSINSIGAILSTFTFGFITLFLGCKRTILLLAVPSVIFFVLIFFGDTYYHILFARFMTGWSGGGIQTTLIIYIADVANNDIRGKLGSLSPLLRNIGVLLAFVLGAVLQYHIVPCVFISIPIIFAIWFALLPNTPQYHLKRGNFPKAEDALKFYKGIKGNSTVEYTAFKAEMERLKSLANDRTVDGKIQLKDILNRPALLGLLNGIVLSNLAYLTGYLVYTTYTVIIFKESGAKNIDPYVASIACAVIQLIGNSCTATLSDSIGRKALLIISLLGSAAGVYLFALFCYLRYIGYDVTAFEWIPVTSLSFVIFAASAGVVPLMFLSMVENIPAKIRTVGLTICNVIMNAVSFILLKMFPILIVSIGLHGAMLIFAVACTIGSFYVFFVIEETKGIALDEQQNNNNNNKKALA